MASLWYSEGDSLVRREGKDDTYVFVVAPKSGDFSSGQAVPKDWPLRPANNEARDEIDAIFQEED